jgi:prepilin-type N-terminal cleavage/methylation domain-containing protein
MSFEHDLQRPSHATGDEPMSGTTDAAPESPGAGSAQRSHRRDAGFTLVEAVVAIALMSIVVVPVLGAVMASIEASSRGRSAAQIETVIVNAADRVNRAPTTCGYVEYVRAALGSQQWDPNLATVVEEHYVPAAQPNQAGEWVPGACVIDSPTELLVQRVTIRVSSPDGKVNRQIQVVKSDV